MQSGVLSGCTVQDSDFVSVDGKFRESIHTVQDLEFRGNCRQRVSAPCPLKDSWRPHRPDPGNLVELEGFQFRGTSQNWRNFGPGEPHGIGGILVPGKLAEFEEF